MIMKFSEKKYIVLKKLYEQGIVEKYHDLSKLLSIDSISISTQEMSAIADTLEEDGFVKLLKSKTSLSAMITGKGYEHMENKLYQSDKDALDFTDDETDEMHKRLDEILRRLDQMDLGQQITYDDLLNEINELKRLLNKLNKKNWREVFQGKLISMGLGQLTEKGIELLSSAPEIQKLL